MNNFDEGIKGSLWNWDDEWLWVAQCQLLANSLIPVPVEDWVWDISVWGKRVLVRKVPKDTMIGRIIVPDTIQTEQKAGWVLSVGPEICIPDLARFPNVAPYETPFELVGRPVFWSAYAGADVYPPEARPSTETNYAMITIGDILGCARKHPIPEEVDDAK